MDIHVSIEDLKVRVTNLENIVTFQGNWIRSIPSTATVSNLAAVIESDMADIKEFITTINEQIASIEATIVILEQRVVELEGSVG